MTQEEKVLKFMRENAGITSMQAFHYLNITRLSGRIFDLRQKGHNIISVRVNDKDADGRPVSYARYVIKE